MTQANLLDGAAMAQVASFQCLQPFVGTILAFVVLGEEPSLWDLGAVGVIAGLALVAYDRKDVQPHPLVNRLRRIISLKELPLQGAKADQKL